MMQSSSITNYMRSNCNLSIYGSSCVALFLTWSCWEQNNETSAQSAESNEKVSPAVISQQHSEHSNRSNLNYGKAKTHHKILYKVFGKDLPIPRILTPDDPLFDAPEMRRGLAKRKRDEKELERIQKDIMTCLQVNDRKCIESNMQRVSELMYGKGVTLQVREDFLIKYGCTPYDDTILDKILSFGKPIMDIGAGNGQWSRALENRLQERGVKVINDYIVAYDDGSAIPLNTEIYHKFTQPAKDNFFSVQTMDGVDAVKLIKNRGRLLLLVYPPPGDMALEVVKSYAEFPGNDLLVFVGEGIGGANANTGLFDFLKSIDDNGNAWVLLEKIDVPDVPGGGKGLEQVFIFQKIKILSGKNTCNK
jgi:hypothetical protein